MVPTADRKERLHKLIEFARVYRGWSRADLARALNRDSTKLFPNTDNPKLELLVALSDILEWPVGDVVEYIWHGTPQELQRNGADFATLDAQARRHHCEGAFAEMARVARQMYAIADGPEQRARAANREVGAWDGLGRFTNARDAAIRGLQQSPISTTRRMQLQANLANAHYTLWELDSAIAHAHVVVEWFRSSPPTDEIDRKTEAFTYYVRGNAFRRMLGRVTEQHADYCARAEADLEHCLVLHERLVQDLGDERLSGIAATAEAALFEVRVESGCLAPADAVDELNARLEAVVDPAADPVADALESYGWCCVFGANIALRHLEGRPLQQHMAIFTNKALEIADRLDNWALRERVFSVQYRLHETLVDATGLELPYTIDDEDRRLITGTMGRFPEFRSTGWKIIQTAKVVRGSGSVS